MNILLTLYSQVEYPTFVSYAANIRSKQGSAKSYIILTYIYMHITHIFFMLDTYLNIEVKELI